MLAPLSTSQVGVLSNLKIPEGGELSYPTTELPFLVRVKRLAEGLFADTLQEIGKGADKIVYLSHLIREDGSCSMVARAVFNQAKRKSIAEARAESEFRMLEDVEGSPFVIRCLAKSEEVCGRTKRPVLYFPLYPTDLSSKLKAPIPFGDDEISIIQRSLSKALKHLEKIRVIHRDIKPANVLLLTAGNTPFGEVKEAVLADFGSAARIDDLKSKNPALITLKRRDDLDNVQKILRDIDNHLVASPNLRQTTMDEYVRHEGPVDGRVLRAARRSIGQVSHRANDESDVSVSIVDPAKRRPGWHKVRRNVVRGHNNEGQAKRSRSLSPEAESEEGHNQGSAGTVELKGTGLRKMQRCTVVRKYNS